MARHFIDGGEIRLTVKDKIFCDVEGEVGVERRLPRLVALAVFVISSHIPHWI